MNMRIVQFDFENGDYILTVAYTAGRNMNDEIEDAVSSYIESNEDDWDYEDLVKDVMNSFEEIKAWEEIDCRRIRI